MVKIIVGNVYSKIAGFLPSNVVSDLTVSLSYKIQGARYIPSVIDNKWDGVIRLYLKNQGQSFYTGLMALVREILKKNNIQYEMIDRRVRPEQNLLNLIFTPPRNYSSREYQEFTIDRALKFTRGILSVCTGGGKTLMVVKIISRIKTYPFIFYVLTKDLMVQAHEVMSNCLNEPIGMIGDGQVDIKKINVCTIQTAVMALNYGRDIKISDYQFDEEDVWDEKSIESAEKARQVKDMIMGAKGLYLDECLSGKTRVVTEHGLMRIDDIGRNKCRFVQTHDGNNIVLRPIRRWWDNGIKDTLKIILSNGETITCTENHLILTKRGWVVAKQLTDEDCVFCANVAAEKKSLLPISIGLKSSYLGTRLKPELKKNGQRSIGNILMECYCDWITIRNIKKGRRQRVYDIEVEDTHCFFANNILVHNCHHTAASTCKDVLTSSVNAYWRYGGSATPYRESKDEILIQGMFGAKIVDISASYLIQKGFLVKPYIFFVPVEDNTKYHSYAKIYKYCVSKNQFVNQKIAELANHMVKRGLSVLVLVKTYAHGNYLKPLIHGSEFMTGKMTSVKRTEILNKLRSREIKVVIATSLADEGLDVPTLDAAILAGGGSSANRVNQRIGRTLRKSNDSEKKDKSIIIIYDHTAKYLQKHSNKTRRLLKKEKEFVIKNSKGLDYICNEVDGVLGYGQTLDLFNEK